MTTSTMMLAVSICASTHMELLSIPPRGLIVEEAKSDG